MIKSRIVFSVRIGLVLCFTSMVGLMVKASETCSLADSRLDWWRAARFGMFIHWGPVSLKGTEIGWSRAGERRDRGDRGTEIPSTEYDLLYTRFNPTNFNATEWIEVAKTGGMKYLVFTAKHHDGFCEFDSQVTNYKITRSPFGRDVCAELAQAAHQAGIRLGFYYSPPDWHHPDFFTDNHARYIEYLHRQVRELLTNYGQLDILWFDADGGKNLPETWNAPRLMAMVHQLQPATILTKRCAGLGDFDTPEQHVGSFQTEPWETCMTLCTQWAWKPNDHMKSLKQCVDTLVSCAGGDGNLLLNVGPMPDGRIEPRQVQRLQEIGAWVASNGESIYGTRGGPFKPGPYGASTRKGKTIFVHVLNWPGKTLRLPAIPAKIMGSRTLNGTKPEVRQTATEIEIAAPNEQRNELDTIIALDLDTDACGLAAVEVKPLTQKKE